MIVIIDNYDSFTYNLYQLIASIYPHVIVIRNDAMTVSEIIALNPKAIILSPGPGRPEEAGICVELIRTSAPTIPLLGVCLGHQAIAFAFGAKVSGAPEIIHGKKSLIFHRRKGMFQGCSLPLSVGRYHSLVASELPPTLCMEAEDHAGTIMAIKHQEFPCYGVQFHPESILTSQGELLMRNFLKEAGL